MRAFLVTTYVHLNQKKMKIIVLMILCIMMSYVLFGQDVVGDWNGALSVQGRQIRIVFHVSKVNNQYEATMDSPDQNATGTKVTLTNFTYPNVTFEISSIGAVYEGTMSDKGITGKWMQSGTALFMVLVKRENASDENK